MTNMIPQFYQIPKEGKDKKWGKENNGVGSMVTATDRDFERKGWTGIRRRTRREVMGMSRIAK